MSSEPLQSQFLQTDQKDMGKQTHLVDFYWKTTSTHSCLPSWTPSLLRKEVYFSRRKLYSFREEPYWKGKGKRHSYRITSSASLPTPQKINEVKVNWCTHTSICCLLPGPKFVCLPEQRSEKLLESAVNTVTLSVSSFNRNSHFYATKLHKIILFLDTFLWAFQFCLHRLLKINSLG